MHGLCTMMGIAQDKCKALSDKVGKGQVFTSAVEILKSLF